MKLFNFIKLNEVGDAVVSTVTREDILELHYATWFVAYSPYLDQSKYSKESLQDACIADWCVKNSVWR